MARQNLLCLSRPLLFVVTFAATRLAAVTLAFNPFMGSPRPTTDKPKLILISGPPGTGKSTFGMALALDQGILKCISTDTVRAVMRSFVAEEVSPALHRSSYAPAYGDDDPVRSWRETCAVFTASIEGLVDDAIHRKVSLVVEGVHVVPSMKLIEKWEASGGVATGCLLQITDANKHKKLLVKRGFITGNASQEEKKIQAYDRVRAIQDEMIRLADEANWLRIEQRTEPDPLDMVSSRLCEEDCGASPEATITKEYFGAQSAALEALTNQEALEVPEENNEFNEASHHQSVEDKVSFASKDLYGDDED